MAHTIGWQESHSSQRLVEYRILEDIGTSNEVHTSISELKAYAERVIETVLVVRYHYARGAIDRHILETNDMLFAEVETRIDKLQIYTECLQKEGVIAWSSFHKDRFLH